MSEGRFCSGCYAIDITENKMDLEGHGEQDIKRFGECIVAPRWFVHGSTFVYKKEQDCWEETNHETLQQQCWGRMSPAPGL